MLDQATNHLYHHARDRGRRGQVWSALTRRSRHLLALTEIDATCASPAFRCPEIQAVPIRQIRGSRGRSHDFDRDFNPLQDYTKGRWLSVAGARQRGKALPPVELIQVGDLYFVQDGHHRISVARALGQQCIEAEVTAWRVTGPLPWDRPVRAPLDGSAGQPIGVQRAFGRLQHEGAQLQEQTLLSLRNLLSAVRMALIVYIVSETEQTPY
jgi:hypothetical protein